MPLESFGNNCQSVPIKGNRPLQPGRWEDSGGELLVNVSMWRNGGASPRQTHMCDGCVILGLQHAKLFVDGALAALNSPAQADGGAS